MKKSLLAAIAALAVAGSANAAPITYLGTLQPATPVLEVNTQGAGNQNDPVGADYWGFYADAGDAITVFGDRMDADGHYDMSFWILFGQFADTNDFGASFDFADSSFAAFGDDQDAPNFPGPFGDPRVVFVAPSSGFYTIAVTNFLSDAGPPNSYRLQANGVNVPEPLTLSLLGLGLAAAAVRRRRS